jgi:hypothetical protein
MILDLVGKVLKTVIGVVGSDSVKQAAATIEQAISSSDTLQLELRRLEIDEKRVLLEETQSLHGLYKAELQSDDKFVRRVRPAIVWVILAVIVLNFGVLPVLNTVAVWCGWTPVALVYPDLPDQFYYLAGLGITVYTGARSYDKKQKRKS